MEASEQWQGHTLYYCNVSRNRLHVGLSAKALKVLQFNCKRGKATVVDDD